MLAFILALIFNWYYANAEVVDIENGNTVILETDDGNIWAYDKKGYAVGDKVTIKFNGHFTDDVTDDSIVRIYAER